MRRGVKVVTEANIRRFAKNFNALKLNHENLMKADGSKMYRENSIPDLAEDILMLVDFFKSKFGTTRTALKTSTRHSNLAGGPLPTGEQSFKRMLAAREGLREYVKKCLGTGELYNELVEEEDGDIQVEEVDGGEGGDDDDDDDDDGDDAIMDEDTLEERARKKTLAWMKKNKPTLARGESEEEYAKRVQVMYQEGMAARASRRRLTRREAAREEVDPEEEEEVDRVGAAARNYFDAQKQVHAPRPHKILEHRDHENRGREYHVLWHDVGYGGQDRDSWQPRDFVMKLPGLIENYQAVPPPT